MAVDINPMGQRIWKDRDELLTAFSSPTFILLHHHLSTVPRSGEEQGTHGAKQKDILFPATPVVGHRQPCAATD